MEIMLMILMGLGAVVIVAWLVFAVWMVRRFVREWNE